MKGRREEITIVPDDDCEIYETNHEKVGSDNISHFCQDGIEEMVK